MFTRVYSTHTHRLLSADQTTPANNSQISRLQAPTSETQPVEGQRFRPAATLQQGEQPISRPVEVSKPVRVARRAHASYGEAAPTKQGAITAQSIKENTSEHVTQEEFTSVPNTAVSQEKQYHSRPEEVLKSASQARSQNEAAAATQSAIPAHTNKLSTRNLSARPKTPSARSTTFKVGSYGRHQSTADKVSAKSIANVEFWGLSDEAVDSGDYKQHSTNEDWRARVLRSHDALFETIKDAKRPLRQAARLIRSKESDQVQVEMSTHQQWQRTCNQHSRKASCLKSTRSIWSIWQQKASAWRDGEIWSARHSMEDTRWKTFLSHDERPAPAAGGLTGDDVDAGEVSC